MILKDKIALVTGTSRGIGKEIVKRFVEEGSNVYAHARKESDEHRMFCDDLSIKYNVNVVPIYFDFSDYQQIKDKISSIYKDIQNISILVNNVSIMSQYKMFQMTNINDIKSCFDINFFSQIYIMQLISKLMIKNKFGSIVNITSVAGLDGTGELAYVTSKSAIASATKQLAIELGNYNIRVNAVAPGLTNTDMGNSLIEDSINMTLAHQVLSKKAETLDIANAILFLASDMASHITGQILRVDGGMLK